MIDFLANNYFWILLICVVLIFLLVAYLAYIIESEKKQKIETEIKEEIESIEIEPTKELKQLKKEIEQLVEDEFVDANLDSIDEEGIEVIEVAIEIEPKPIEENKSAKIEATQIIREEENLTE